MGRAIISSIVQRFTKKTKLQFLLISMGVLGEGSINKYRNPLGISLFFDTRFRRLS